MTRVFPLPAPARMSTGPSVVSTAARCCGFSFSRKDNWGKTPASILQGINDSGSSLNPGSHQLPQTTAHAQPIEPVFEIKGVDFFRLQHLNPMKSQASKLSR